MRERITRSIVAAMRAQSITRQNAILMLSTSPQRSLLWLAAILAGQVGEWLSLVEHLVRDQGVGGSNPLSPTNLSTIYFQQLHRTTISIRARASVGALIRTDSQRAGNNIPR